MRSAEPVPGTRPSSGFLAVVVVLFKALFFPFRDFARLAFFRSRQHFLHFVRFVSPVAWQIQDELLTLELVRKRQFHKFDVSNIR